MDVFDWLLEGDPAIRWQVLRDLTGASPGEVQAEQERVATEGWGARLLDLQEQDGQWAGGTYWPATDEDPDSQPWTATTYSLLLLRDFGLDPTGREARGAIALVRDNSRWEEGNQLFFDGEVEPCINGMAVALGAYFGEHVHTVAARLIREQLTDGGWNCEAERGSTRSSFHTTICVLEGLVEYERATGGTTESRTARHRGEEYLLERGLLRHKSTGGLINSDWLQFSYPTRWYYDVLRGLDYFRAAGGTPDKRMDEAVKIVQSKAQRDGRWLLENTHAGTVHFPLEDGDGQPSRWNTLRALRVLRWYEAG
ncbi:MAG: hypothetical protein ABWY04_22610 [Arthrobacter sp.]